MWARAAKPPAPVFAESALKSAAVIDVGSNSVRLVMYRLEGRSIWTVHNEKVLAALGQDLAVSGKLNPSGVEAALAALRRFRALLDAAEIDSLFTAATAAVREAVDGPAFIARIREEAGLDIRVLSGEEEARYSALGVVGGSPYADGVVADLGGSSLELIRVRNGEPGGAVTLPLGPFALGAPKPFDPDHIKSLIERRLDGVEVYRAPEFHAVGGAWRNLALLHMRMSDYPLQIVHQYEISGREAAEAARFIARQSKNSLERIGGGSKKRAETMPYAAAVLECLIERLDVAKLTVSAYGVREGLLFDAMPAQIRAQDPLLQGASAIAGRPAETEILGAALEAWTGPLFDALPPLFGPRDAVLTAAACRLADLGSRFHPDHRANLVFEQVLRAPIAGMNHAERAFLAIAAFARHTAVVGPPEGALLSRLLSPLGQRRALALGAAVRLGCDLSGKRPALLAASGLRLEGEALVLSAVHAQADLLLGEQTRKRAETLATALGRKLVVRAE